MTLNQFFLVKKDKKQTNNDWKENWFISESQFSLILDAISSKLYMDTHFNIIPTIDCFASSAKRLKLCKKYITKKEDFFNQCYDSIEFWQNEVAYICPPVYKKTAIKALHCMKQRRIKGLFCYPVWKRQRQYNIDDYWLGNAKKECITHYLLHINKTKYNILAMWFDYTM